MHSGDATNSQVSQIDIVRVCRVIPRPNDQRGGMFSASWRCTVKHSSTPKRDRDRGRRLASCWRRHARSPRRLPSIQEWCARCGSPHVSVVSGGAQGRADAGFVVRHSHCCGLREVSLPDVDGCRSILALTRCGLCPPRQELHPTLNFGPPREGARHGVRLESRVATTSRSSTRLARAASRVPSSCQGRRNLARPRRRSPSSDAADASRARSYARSVPAAAHPVTATRSYGPEGRARTLDPGAAQKVERVRARARGDIALGSRPRSRHGAAGACW